MSYRTPFLSLALLGGLFAGLVPAALHAQLPSALQVIEGAAARYRGTAPVCANFSQERTVALLGEKHNGRGRLCQQLPNFFMMRFTEPAGDRLIADGREFCQYTPSTDPKQAICIPMAKAGGAYDFRKEFLDRTAEKFQVRLAGQEAVDGSQTHRISLLPRQPSGYREAVLWIDTRSSLVRRVEIREENGSVTRISMSDIDLNARPPADAFRFTAPPGVEVLRP
jgi:outer membrane lipoprotein carrier protein